MYIYMCVYIYVDLYVHVCVYVYVNVYVHVYVFIYVYVCVPASRSVELDRLAVQAENYPREAISYDAVTLESAGTIEGGKPRSFLTQPT